MTAVRTAVDRRAALIEDTFAALAQGERPAMRAASFADPFIGDGRSERDYDGMLDTAPACEDALAVANGATVAAYAGADQEWREDRAGLALERARWIASTAGLVGSLSRLQAGESFRAYPAPVPGAGFQPGRHAGTGRDVLAWIDRAEGFLSADLARVNGALQREADWHAQLSALAGHLAAVARDGRRTRARDARFAALSALLSRYVVTASRSRRDRTRGVAPLSLAPLEHRPYRGTLDTLQGGATAGMRAGAAQWAGSRCPVYPDPTTVAEAVAPSTPLTLPLRVQPSTPDPRVGTSWDLPLARRTAQYERAMPTARTPERKTISRDYRLVEVGGKWEAVRNTAASECHCWTVEDASEVQPGRVKRSGAVVKFGLDS